MAQLDDRRRTDLETLVIFKVGGKIIYNPSDIRAIYTGVECVCGKYARSGTVCSCEFERQFLPRIEATMFEIDPSPSCRGDVARSNCRHRRLHQAIYIGIR